MTDREQYTPGSASGAQVRKDGEKWTLILVRELRHSPEKVWQALTYPAQLREWAPFDVDGSLDTVGATVKLTWVGTPTPLETKVTRADAPRLLEYDDIRWELEAFAGGTRLTLWHNIDRRFISWGAAGWHISFDVLDRLLSGTPVGRIVGPDAMKLDGWQRLTREYARQFGVETPESVRKYRHGIIDPAEATECDSTETFLPITRNPHNRTMTTAFTDPSAVLDLPAFRPEMAFPLLTDTMIETIRAYASEVMETAGTTIFSRGQRGADMFVVLEGNVNIYPGDEENTSETVIDLGPNQFTGELNMLNDQPSLVGARTTVPSALLRVKHGNLRQLMRSEGEIANLILQAFIWRRIGLASQAKVGVTLIGHEGEAETLKLQRFLRRNGFPHHVTSVEAYKRASLTSAPDQDSWPAVAFGDGRVFHRPFVPTLADELGISELPDKSTTYDVAVVGAGPAGLAAAVYASSEGLSTIAIEGIAPGGQAGTSSKIENYLGFPTGISGQRLAHRAFVQSLKFGVRFAVSREAVTLERESDRHKITLEGGISFCSRSVVIATGAQYRKLPLENFEKFENQGIYYAATGMETDYCRDKPVVVVGGGNSAGQAALFLSQTATHVYLMIRSKSLAATMSEYLLSRIEKSRRITILTETEIVLLEGKSRLEQVTWVNRRDGSTTTKRIEDLFVMIGAQPNTSWLKGVVALDEKGFVITGGQQAFESTPYATNATGLYAVGDVRAASVKRVASAVGEGSVVISDVYRYLALHQDALAMLR